MSKPAKDCECCTRRFEMFDNRLREAVELFRQDLIKDGAKEKYIENAIGQTSRNVEEFIRLQWEGV